MILKPGNLSFFILLFILLGNPKKGFGQEILTDTTFIEFKADTFIPLNFRIDSVTDSRNVTKSLVGYGSKRKFILVPVDKEICLQQPLGSALENGFIKNSNHQQSVSLDIKHFIIEKQHRRLSSYYVLEADIVISDSAKNYGYLSYNYFYLPRNKKDSKETIYEDAIKQWHPFFKIDLNSSLNFSKGLDSLKPEAYIEQPYHRYSYFTVNAATVVGSNFWQLDGEINFSRPETPTSKVFQGSIIRYQNTKDFELIAFGKRSEHYLLRINPSLLFHANSNLLIGINKWRDNEDIKLEQILQIALSSYQTISYNKVNKTGINIQAGLFENAYYIIHEPIKFQIGIYFAIGYKF